VNILGVGVSAIHRRQALDQIACWIEHRIQTYVVVAPVSSIMYAHQDPTLRQIINAAGMVTPDGMPLVFLSRWMGYRHVDRVYGPDLMLAVSALMATCGYSSFYYGGAEGIPELLATKMTARFPGLKIVGTYSTPFRALTLEEDAAVVARINAANPDVVWVALGNQPQAGVLDGRTPSEVKRACVDRRRGSFRFSRRTYSPGPALDAVPRSRMAVPSRHRAAPPLAAVPGL
jgi:N-acetylglucosaminyldiphosphoundecaprenol N-acetyl-beta-D-mannosaminyltransferase